MRDGPGGSAKEWMDMKRCMIVSGSPDTGVLPVAKDEYVIACDAGVGHALKAGIRPDLLVGDFDTYTETLPEGIPVLTAPAEKDDTDTMMAVRYALEQGFESIRIGAALGGRLDHSIGNLSAAAYVAERLGSCTVYGARETAILLYNSSVLLRNHEICGDGKAETAFGVNREQESTVLPVGSGKQKKKFVSVFSWTDEAKGVSYRGLKYPLSDATLTRAFALGISNEFAEEEAEISVKDGMLLIVIASD